MAQLPKDDDSPFSLPHDTPEMMPIDYPGLNGNIDPHEAYDEGLDDTIDTEPYRKDDDPIKSAKQLLLSGIAGKEYYTTNIDIIRHWAEYRYGHPGRIVGTEDNLEFGGLYIYFEDDEPDIAIEPIDWHEFLRIFETHQLAFLFRTKNPNGSLSKYYRFMSRISIGEITEAEEVKLS